MSTREATKAKETLKQHKQNFKELLAPVDEAKEEIHRKLYKQISALDEQNKKEVVKIKNRKKMLAFKANIQQAYATEEQNLQQIPVDGQLKTGSMVFMKNCASCHSLQAIDTRPMKGPSLGLIFNRKAGANTNYETYSLDLLKSTFYWSSKNLYNFMYDTKSLLPNTKCRLATKPLKSEEERADLLALFKQFTGELMFNMRLKQIGRSGYQSFQTSLHVAKQQKKRGEMRQQSQKSKERII